MVLITRAHKVEGTGSGLHDCQCPTASGIHPNYAMYNYMGKLQRRSAPVGEWLAGFPMTVRDRDLERYCSLVYFPHSFAKGIWGTCMFGLPLPSTCR